MSDDVLTQLIEREPVLHLREFVNSPAAVDDVTTPDFWEVGASGRVYDRGFVREEIARRLAIQEQDDLVTQGWRTSEHRVRELAHGVYLFTYVLDQGGRRSRRATVWDRRGGCWRMVYHQGTIVETTPPAR